MSKVIHIGEIKNDGTLFTPEQTLQSAIDHIGKKGALKNGKKIVILCLDDTNENYTVSWYQCGMTMSQCMPLCEVGKMKFLKEMDHA